MTITFKQQIPPFPAERIEAVANNTTEGLTSLEINHLLRNCDVRIPRRK